MVGDDALMVGRIRAVAVLSRAIGLVLRRPHVITFSLYADAFSVLMMQPARPVSGMRLRNVR